MTWNEISGNCHAQTFPNDGRLTSLPAEWQRELAALWRLESDVNNGAYLQFLENWGRDSYVYASQALMRIGARQMAKIVDECQSLVDLHVNPEAETSRYRARLMPIRICDDNGQMIEHDSILPDDVVDRIYDLSYEFMNYPDDFASLGMSCYQRYFEGDAPGR